MKNKNLWIVFALLAGLYVFSQFFSGKNRNRSFDPEIFTIDTSAISKIEISSKSDNYEAFSLERSNGLWLAQKGSISTKAENSALQSFMTQLAGIKATRVAAKKKEKWSSFEVGEEEAKAHVKVYEGNKCTADFWLGGFRFNNQNQTAVSFIRKGDAEEVFAVDGFASMSMSQGFSGYRNKSLLEFNPADITNLSFTQNGQTQALSKTGNKWISSTGEPLDSTKVANYLKALSNFNASKFADDFSETQATNAQKASLKLAGNNLLSPIRIDCYQVPGREPAFVARSSQKSDTWFAGDSLSLYRGLFKDLKELE